MSEQTETTNNVSISTTGERTEVLPSGVKVVIKPFKGRHIMQAQKIAGQDTEKYLPALIALTCEFDGTTKVAEDIEEMPGWDVLRLMALFSGEGKNF
jgi:hypothetical protein